MTGASEVPRVQVSTENDMRLKPPGKVCARAGLPHLPGGMMRSHSSPMALTCPGGWLDQHQQRMETRSREYRDRLRETSSQSSAMATGEWGNKTATMRPGTCVPTIAAPAGGKTLGAKQLRPHSQGAEYTAMGDRPPTTSSQGRWHTGAPGFTYGADSRHLHREKHGWHDPRGQAESQRLAISREDGSHAWYLRKARDHVGYGADGIVNWGDIQVTAVSGDAPPWFVGSRTVPGPFSTRYVPVRRCPYVHIDGKDMRIRAKTYKQGPHLDVIETLHEGQNAPAPRKAEKPMTWQEKITAEHPAKRNNLKHGGCMTIKQEMPPSNYRSTS